MSKRRKGTTRRTYNLSLTDLDEMLAEQDHQCPICHKEIGLSACVDHDHLRGNIRGMLCNKCNAGLGFFEDDPKLLTSALLYLHDAMRRLVD